MGSTRCLATSVLVLAFFLALSSSAEAQEGSRGSSSFVGAPITGVGYTPVLPEAFLGAGFLRFFSAGTWGVFGDWKMVPTSLRDHEDFYKPPPEVTTLDPVIQTTDEWLAFNVGVMRALSEDMAIMLGLGMAERVRIHEHLIMSNSAETEEGIYYTKNHKYSGWMVNPMVGLLFRGGRSVAFRFGVERGPRWLSGGVYFLLP